jgi:hypothetical protein
VYLYIIIKPEEAVMKNRILISIAVLALCFSFQQLNGQEKSQEQKDKEAKLQQAIELQKKQMAEQKKLEDLQQVEVDKALQEANDEVAKSAGGAVYNRHIRPNMIGRDFSDQSFYFNPGIDFPGNDFFGHGGDGERTTWDFSRYVKESSFSKQYSFDVEKTVGTVVMTVMGDCKAGEIRVKIVMPGGKTYSDIVIDESGNLNWRKSFTISEEENKDKAGEWIFKIDAAKATGSFKISLQTY